MTHRVFNAVIIDDEQDSIDLLSLLLQQECPEINVVAKCTGSADGIRAIRESSPEVVFLDIEMPEMNGFELLDQLEDQVPQVIFTTAFDQYAIKAFEVNALDYLLKPIAPARLAAALQRAHACTPKVGLNRLFVRDGDRCWIVRVSDISLLESEANYVRLHFAKERPLIRRSLNTLERQLDPAVFFRANRKQIVNLNWIEKTSLGVSGGLTALLRNGRTVAISRRQSLVLRSLLHL
jgi:two-component system LytT family response regulator